MRLKTNKTLGNDLHSSVVRVESGTWLCLAMLERKTLLSPREELLNGSLAMLCVSRQHGQCLRQVGSSQLDDLDVVWTCRLSSVSGLKLSLGYMRRQAGLELLFMVVIDTVERERT